MDVASPEFWLPKPGFGVLVVYGFSCPLTRRAELWKAENDVARRQVIGDTVFDDV